jgi:hypothetical protein
LPVSINTGGLLLAIQFDADAQMGALIEKQPRQEPLFFKLS